MLPFNSPPSSQSHHQIRLLRPEILKAHWLDPSRPSHYAGKITDGKSKKCCSNYKERVTQVTQEVLSGSLFLKGARWRMRWVWPTWRWCVPKVSLNSAWLFKGFLVLCGTTPAGKELFSSAFTFQTLFLNSCQLDIFRQFELPLQHRPFIWLHSSGTDGKRCNVKSWVFQVSLWCACSVSTGGLCCAFPCFWLVSDW